MSLSQNRDVAEMSRDGPRCASRRREIAVLRQLTHVSVARLVASFRWRAHVYLLLESPPLFTPRAVNRRADVYLLLEFAARGDLHSAVRRFGSLAAPNARFLLGEVCVGLSHVHAAGFAFGDLKPRPPHTASGEAVNGVAA